MGRIQDNEYSTRAKQWAQQTGHDPCEFIRAAKKDPGNQSKATRLKLKQAEKYLGCDGKQRRRIK
jgi:hypothetical protein